MKQITLSQGKFALVDDEDYDYFNQWKWSAAISGKRNYTYYAIRKTSRKNLINGKRRTILMHRQIIGLSNPKIQVDHIDGNGLNNQKSNLRQATQSENNANRAQCRKQTTSQYLGVSWHKGSNKWCAAIQKNGKVKHIGSFKNEIDAYEAYKIKAKEVHGEFASRILN